MSFLGERAFYRFLGGGGVFPGSSVRFTGITVGCKEPKKVLCFHGNRLKGFINNTCLFPWSKVVVLVSLSV